MRGNRARRVRATGSPRGAGSIIQDYATILFGQTFFKAPPPSRARHQPCRFLPLARLARAFQLAALVLADRPAQPRRPGRIAGILRIPGPCSQRSVSAAGQILRLLSMVFFAAHLFACIFWSVASTYRTPDELSFLLADKNAPPDVSAVASVRGAGGRPRVPRGAEIGAFDP